MFSLPNVVAMNDRAVVKAAALEDQETVKCEYCDTDARLKYTKQLEVYDPLQGGACDVEIICDACFEKGAHQESLGWCEVCNRYFPLNYSWERYETVTDNGTVLCIRCTGHEFFKGKDGDYADAWFTKEELDRLKALTIDNMRLPHIHGIGSDREKPDNIDEIEGETMDSYFAERFPPERMLESLKTRAMDALMNGYEAVGFAMTEAGQFQVYVQVFGSK